VINYISQWVRREVRYKSTHLPHVASDLRYGIGPREPEGERFGTPDGKENAKGDLNQKR
jgi:hypothetical protein